MRISSPADSSQSCIPVTMRYSTSESSATCAAGAVERRFRILPSHSVNPLASGADVAVGLAPYALVRASFPEMKKTVLRFSDGEYCGCNLFAFLTPAGRAMADRWREVEQQRKSPLKVIRMLGWSALLRYRLGLLSLDAAMELLSRRFKLRLVAVRMPFADAAVDVDSVDDHRLVEARLTASRKHS